ncbi:MAG: cysteine desulfurase [Phycisphaerae bacterium]|jgi:cysteine desulfurase|nr:cysteine desulfurase [Phycisphaerae bacterium]MBT5409663.1 cysteine desulfurase [Phycisphaerae bacterium]MBT6164625.1 cysteine desulfurase [Phycisphaerae bacterium]
MKKVIYLDNNATTAPLPSVTKAVLHAMETLWGNPSSIHRVGQEARHQVDEARAAVASLINCEAARITFTSGGTEAANLALKSACAMRPNRKMIITSQVEHAAVGEAIDLLVVENGYNIVRLENCSDGIVCLKQLEKLLQDHAEEIAVVSVMWCNNETGVIEPIEKIVALCHAHGVLVHSDGTQWVAKMPVDVQDVPIDLLTFASHKFHGPKGVGAMYSSTGITVSPLVTGGPQERGRRGGTENVPAILGFGVAATEAMLWLTEENIHRMESQREMFETLLASKIPTIHINSSGAPRAWTTSSISFPEVKGELMLLMLSEQGVCASSGSACSSGALKGSKVIEAIGTPGDGEWGAVRFSFARTTTEEELTFTVGALVTVVQTIHSIVSAASEPQTN